MKILAIETSTLLGSIALLEEREGRLHVCGEKTLSVSVQHSEHLLPAIEQLLCETNLPSPLMGEGEGEGGEQGIDLLAVAKGPGSFTGLRIGMATAQGLAVATGRPIVGISTLEGLALNGFFFKGLVVPLLDARRGEVYAAGYESLFPEISFEIRIPEQVTRLEDFLKLLEEERDKRRFLFVGPGVSVYWRMIQDRLGGAAFQAPVALNEPRAVSIGTLAWAKGLQKEFTGLAYLRPAHLTFPVNRSHKSTRTYSEATEAKE